MDSERIFIVFSGLLVLNHLCFWSYVNGTGCGDDTFQYCLSKFDDVSPEHMTEEQRLLYRLMRSYDRASRPVYDAAKPVNIKLGLSLTQVLDVDEKNQVLTVNVWLDQEWRDERLVWNNISEFSKMKILRIPCDLIWVPDIVLYNSVDEHNRGYMKSLAMVHSDGNVFWPPIVRMRSSCKMDITYFPFDDQICKLKLGSWAYDGFQVDVSNRSLDMDLTNFVDNGEWTLIATKVQRNVIYYPCCPEPFPDVTFYIQLRRRVLYYFLNVIIPCILLSTLTLTGFLLPPDSGEKITLGLTVLLAFSVFMLLIAENMPPTSEYIPLIGVYLTIIMAMSALSVIFSVFVLNFHHKRTGTRPPSAWLKSFARSLACLTCTRIKFSCDIYKAVSVMHSPLDDQRMQENGCLQINEELITDSHENSRDSGVHNSDIGSFNVNGRGKNNNTNGVLNLQYVETILSDYVRRVVSGHDRTLEEIQVLNDWREIARVLDRLLFIIFGIVTVTSTVTLLVISPATKSLAIEQVLNQL